MRSTLCLALTGLMLAQAVAISQPERSTAAQQRDTARRVHALKRQLEVASDERRNVGDFFKTLDRVTQAIWGEVDEFITSAIGPGEASEQIDEQLERLVDYRPDPEFGDPPLAVASQLRGGPALLVAYTIPRPPHFDLATIRGYQRQSEHFALVATTGEDFDGHSMFKSVLPSPVRGELWLLCWGYGHTFNGRRVRFRLYAFDGAGFRTVWRPDDIFDAEVSFTVAGFAIDHYVRREPYTIHDEYMLTPEGAVKVISNDVIP